MIHDALKLPLQGQSSNLFRQNDTKVHMQVSIVEAKSPPSNSNACRYTMIALFIKYCYFKAERKVLRDARVVSSEQ